MYIKFIIMALLLSSCSKENVDVFYVAHRSTNNNVKKMFTLSLDQKNMHILQKIFYESKKNVNERDFLKLIINNASDKSDYVLVGERYNGDTVWFMDINEKPPFSVDYISVKWEGNIFNKYPCVEKNIFYLGDFLSNKEKEELKARK